MEEELTAFSGFDAIDCAVSSIIFEKFGAIGSCLAGLRTREGEATFVINRIWMD